MGGNDSAAIGRRIRRPDQLRAVDFIEAGTVHHVTETVQRRHPVTGVVVAVLGSQSNEAIGTADPKDALLAIPDEVR